MDKALSFIPVIGSIISFTFAFLLFKSYSAKKLPFQLAWAVALVLFGLGFVGEVLGLNLGWNQLSAKMYYLFGGVLAVGYLSMGTMYLLKPQPAKWIASISVFIVFLLWIPIFGLKLFKANDLFTAAAIMVIYLLVIVGIIFYKPSTSVLAGLIATSVLAVVGLLQHNIDIVTLVKNESWREVMTIPLRSGAFALSSGGTFIILIGAIYSAATGWSDKARRFHIQNTIIIAVGVLIAALGGTLHGIFDIGQQIILSISTTLGIGVMLAGYLRTSKKK